MTTLYFKLHTVLCACGQCGCDNVTNMSGPSSATPRGSQSDSLGFTAKVLDAWTNARPMKCRAMKCRRTVSSLHYNHICSFVCLFVCWFVRSFVALVLISREVQV